MREPDKLLEFDDWCRLHKLILKYTDMSLWPSLRFLVDQRRSYLANEQMDQYESMAPEITKKEEKIIMQITNFVLNHFEIEWDQFTESF